MLYKKMVEAGSSLLNGIDRGSFILGPLIFHIFINDLIMFIEKSDICNCADDHKNLARACR